MTSTISRDEALKLLRKYNKEPFHIQHGITVEKTMRWFARELGYGDEEDYWGITGLLHDIDFEIYPEEHCRKAPELLKEAGVGEDMIRSVCSHGYGICSDIKPEHEMEKVLFAADELTGLIWAAALMRPSKGSLSSASYPSFSAHGLLRAILLLGISPSLHTELQVRHSSPLLCHIRRRFQP